jgi:cytochrome c6
MKEREMKKAILLLSIMFCFVVVVGSAYAVKKSEQSGQELFAAHCKVCHPDGGNIVNPAKTLHKKDRDANSIKTANDIVKTMRHPGPGMTPFDEKTIANHDAHEIAEYIIKTFK